MSVKRGWHSQALSSFQPLGTVLWSLARHHSTFRGRRIAFKRRSADYSVAMHCPAKLRQKFGLNQILQKPRVGQKA